MPELSQKLGAKPGAEVLVFFTTRRLVDNKSASIDERWQALRFVYRLRDR